MITKEKNSNNFATRTSQNYTYEPFFLITEMTADILINCFETVPFKAKNGVMNAALGCRPTYIFV